MHFKEVTETMTKTRKKLMDKSGELKLRTVWRCYCKIGTTSSKIGYFLNEPAPGTVTQVVEEYEENNRAMSVYIDEVREDGTVFCSRL
jgi:hypothetical protein